jgi:hypothetical protein
MTRAEAKYLRLLRDLDAELAHTIATLDNKPALVIADHEALTIRMRRASSRPRTRTPRQRHHRSRTRPMNTFDILVLGFIVLPILILAGCALWPVKNSFSRFLNLPPRQAYLFVSLFLSLLIFALINPDATARFLWPAPTTADCRFWFLRLWPL